MTIKECIDIVDNKKPNLYSLKDKVMWLSFIDEIIINDVLKTHEGYDGRYDDFAGYSESSLSVPLIVPSPYDRLYTAYLTMKIDSENGETARYNASAQLFNTYMMEYRKHYNKTHMPIDITSDKKREKAKSPAQIPDIMIENIKRELYALLSEELSKKVSDDKIYDIIMKFVNNNAAMLKGKDGINGMDGRDGYTPKKGVDYFDGKNGKPFTYADFTEEQLAALKGEQGEKGDKGDQGERGIQGRDGNDGTDGYTPVKGVDYYTEAEKKEIINNLKTYTVKTDASEIVYSFLAMENTELRCTNTGPTSITIDIPDGEYSEQYISGLVFTSGEIAPTVVYTADSCILQWVGTDCTTSQDGNYSVFIPINNKSYDIVFYFNGTYFVGLVNGYEAVTSNAEA